MTEKIWRQDKNLLIILKFVSLKLPLHYQMETVLITSQHTPSYTEGHMTPLSGQPHQAHHVMMWGVDDVLSVHVCYLITRM